MTKILRIFLLTALAAVIAATPATTIAQSAKSDSYYNGPAIVWVHHYDASETHPAPAPAAAPCAAACPTTSTASQPAEVKTKVVYVKPSAPTVTMPASSFDKLVEAYRPPTQAAPAPSGSSPAEQDLANALHEASARTDALEAQLNALKAQPAADAPDQQDALKALLAQLTDEQQKSNKLAEARNKMSADDLAVLKGIRKRLTVLDWTTGAMAAGEWAQFGCGMAGACGNASAAASASAVAMKAGMAAPLKAPLFY